MNRILVLLIFITCFLPSYSVFKLKDGHLDSINDISKFPFGNITITCSNDETIIIWDIDKNRILKTMELYRGALTSVAFSPGGKYFVVGNKNGNLYVFDYDTELLVDNPKLHSLKISSIVFSEKENVFMSASLDGLINVYDIYKKAVVKTIAMPSKIISLELSPDKKILAAGDDSGNLYLISTKDYKVYSTAKLHTNWISGIAFSPDSKNIATVSWDLTLSIYDLEKSTKVKTINVPSDKALNSIAWSLDNVLLAIASSDSNVYLYSAKDFKPSYTIEGHKKAVYKAIFFPDSSGLISVSADSYLKVWNLTPTSSELIKSYSGY